LLGGRIAPVRAITRGANDDSSPEADAVVQLFDSSPAPAVKLCTGTLITPTAVLTAKHCVTGSDSSLGNFSPAQLPFTVSVGNPIVYPIGSGADPLESAPSSNLLSAAVSLYYGNSDPVNSQETGADLAIIWLTKPLFTAAHIVRPDLRSPVPANGDDGEGGVYDVPIGVAGWGTEPNHDLSFRQVAYYTDDIKHYSGYPDGGPGTPSGQFWVHAQGDGNIGPGDSGGPLFWRQPDGTRQVLGVASLMGARPFAIDGFDCTFNRCDFWTDVTRDATARWIRDQMEDRGRSLNWLDAHRRSYEWDDDGTFHPDYWKGEVDYTGPCDSTLDPDCDHWYTWNDDCPTFYDPAQIEGTICPPPPPPPPAFPPQNCRPMDLCNDGVEVQCDMIDEIVVLQRLDGGAYHDVSVDADASRAHIPFISDYPGDGRDSATYRVCSRNASGDTCSSDSLVVTFSHTSCSSGGGGGGDGLVGRGCGGSWQARCRPILFE
jgi:hypothetical protein